MKNIFFLLAFTSYHLLAFSQSDSQLKQLEESRRFLLTTDVVYPYIDTSPGYPGGDKKWSAYVSGSSVINDAIVEARKNNIPTGVYTVTVKFTVMPDGRVTDIKTVGKPHGYGLEAAARKLIAESGKWIPAHVEGSYTKGSILLPVRFSITN